MSFLKSVKTVNALRQPLEADPTVASRTKLCEAADQQLACVAALIAKKPAPTKTVFKYRDKEDGTRERYEAPAKIKPWFWGDGRKWLLEPRYANKPLLGSGPIKCFERLG